MQYDFDEMAENWNRIREAYRAYRGSGSEVKKEKYHTNLIRQLEHFFSHYPNPFGDDDEASRGIKEAILEASDKADAKARLAKAKALLADIDATIEHNRRAGVDPKILDSLRSKRKMVVLKMDAILRDA